MKRTLPLIVAATLVATSPGLQALDLDELQVQSHLDEPLRARIPLTDLQGIDLDRLRARLANKADFQEAGLPHADVLDDLRLTVRRENGSPVVVLSTEQAVRAPYLELLLTLEWPGGEQRRQVNVLLDPPAYTSAVAADATGKTASIDALPRQLTVEPGDTLGSLANGIRRQFGISSEQAMLALFWNNPDAFADNINVLLAGKVLAIPPRASMTALDSNQARQQVLAQNRAWGSARSGVMENSAPGKAASAKTANVVMVDAKEALALYRGIEEVRATQAPGASDDLKSVTQSSDSSEREQPVTATSEQRGAADNVSALQTNLAGVEELVAVIVRQNERLSALESKLKMANGTLAQIREQGRSAGSHDGQPGSKRARAAGSAHGLLTAWAVGKYGSRHWLVEPGSPNQEQYDDRRWRCRTCNAAALGRAASAHSRQKT